jgi:MinD superfamily P-loop ATPase
MSQMRPEDDTAVKVKNNLTISIASGKGGTGKTTLATNLVAALAQTGVSVAYLDCDVEEPNGHLFLKPETDITRSVEVLIPKVHHDRCTFCGLCSEICQFNAIAVMLDKVLVYPSLCHSCGACKVVCPEDAIEEIPRAIGQIKSGTGMGVQFYEGRLNIGEAMAPPITKELKKGMPDTDIVVIDAPPGTSCPVIEAVDDTDFVVLVTEPTPFGLNDLKLAVEMTKALKLPFGIVINRSDTGDDRVEDYCRDEDLDLMLKIPFDRHLAEVYSRGGMLTSSNNGYSKILLELYAKIKRRVRHD